MMNDPWDVKSVLRSGQYVSCIKMNGVPILPPVLSQECRNEMKYYKLLAKEVEKRIALLQPLIQDSDSDNSSKDRASPTINKEKHIKHVENEVKINSSLVEEKKDINTSLKELSDKCKPVTPKPLKVKELEMSYTESNRGSPTRANKEVIMDVPERDYDWSPRPKNELKTTTNDENKISEVTKELVMDMLLDQPHITDLVLHHDGPSSLGSKSFTGSLNDIHSETIKDNLTSPRLIRQRSYTILTPSPMLIAHLELQSLNTGVEMTSISMSESLSNLNSTKKRRSWDLESAKEKWSHMAMELDKKSFHNNGRSKTFISSPTNKKTVSVSPTVKVKTIVQDKINRSSVTEQSVPNKSNQSIATAPDKISSSPVRHDHGQSKTNSTQKVQNSPKNHSNNVTPVQHTHIVAAQNDTEDPAAKVRELYAKIQKHQLMQMSTLVEKQKREQLMLQQVFEEQNNMLYRQLKTVRPKSPIEIREGWAEDDHGPVSLSQLINHKATDDDKSVKSVINDTSHYLSQCSDVLKKSRDLTSSIKKNQNNLKATSDRNSEETNKTNTYHSKNANITLKHNSNRQSVSPNSRFKQVNNNKHYGDTSSPSDRDSEEPMLTDRTNDTLADLNFTLTDDSISESVNGNINTCIPRQNAKLLQNSPKHRVNGVTSKGDGRITHNPVSAYRADHKVPRKNLFEKKSLSPQEREAASRIVAYAKGYLVRRLMRTDRVQEIVQTIRDALLCALQLHQEREGIRGADVDLHRRLIQQITAACYSLHDTFVVSSPAERCGVIAADRAKKRAVASRQSTPASKRPISTRPTNL